MSNYTLSTILSIVQELTYTVVFLLCAGASYLAMRQSRVKKWVADTGVVVSIVLFIVVTALLYQAISPIISDLFALPRGLVSGDRTAGFTSSARCLSGVLVLVGLAVGSWLLAKETGPAEEQG